MLFKSDWIPCRDTQSGQKMQTILYRVPALLVSSSANLHVRHSGVRRGWNGYLGMRRLRELVKRVHYVVDREVHL